MGKVIFILIDGLSLAAASNCMSYMRAMTEAGRMRKNSLRAMLPPLSRPMYATFLSGLTPLEHGVLHNDFEHKPLEDTLFHDAARSGMRTAAAAYGWFYELCIGEKFDLFQHRMFENLQAPIQHGIFYGSDAYPDQEAFADAESLRRKHKPDLLLVHCMGADFAGHESGGDSPAYREAVRRIDGLLARHVPLWLNAGYNIICLSDHGMNREGNHYDADASCRDIPLWVDKAWPARAVPAGPTHARGCVKAALGL